MSLAPAQLPALNAAIKADPVLNAMPNDTDSNIITADEFNKPAVPNFFAWKTSVNCATLTQGGGFDWTRVDNLTVGKARIWEFMTAAIIIDPSKANVRAGINACFSVAADQATRLAIFQACQRLATRGERLYTTGAGTTSNDTGAGPGLFTFEGLITYQDVNSARNLG